MGAPAPSKLMWIVVYILIVATTVFFIPKNVLDLFRLPKEMIYLLFGFSVIASSWMTSSNKRIVYKNLWGGLFLIFAVTGFCWFYVFPIVMSEGETPYHLWNILPTVNIILGLFLIQVLVENTTGLQNWINLSKVLCWTAFGISIYALLQYIGLDQVFGASQEFIAFTNDWFSRKQLMMSFFGNEFLTTNFIAVISPLCLMFGQKRYKFIYGVIFLTICLADNTTSFFSFMLGLLCYLALTKKYRILILTIILGILCTIFLGQKYPTFFNSAGRFLLWKDIITQTVDSDLVYLGTGFGSFKARGFMVGTQKALQAHNMYIQLFVAGGLAVLIIFGGYLVSLFRRSYFYFKRNDSIVFICYICALITYLFSAGTGFPDRVAPLALVGILYISSLEAQIQGEGLI